MTRSPQRSNEENGNGLDRIYLFFFVFFFSFCGVCLSVRLLTTLIMIDTSMPTSSTSAAAPIVPTYLA